MLIQDNDHRQNRERLQQLLDVTHRLDEAKLELSAKESETNEKDEILQANSRHISKITSELEKSAAAANNLRECIGHLEDEVSAQSDTVALVKAELEEQQNKCSACEQQCESLRADLIRIQVCFPLLDIIKELAP